MAELVERRSGFGARLRGSECEGSKRGSEVWPARRAAASSSSSAQCEREEGEGMEGRRRFPCSREDKGGAQTPRIAGMSDAWRSFPASTVADRGMGKNREGIGKNSARF